jgi:acyl-CoA synthetase (AMP-forming)/AMP-acid ligase II
MVTNLLVLDYPDMDLAGGRTVSYLPLSHAAGMSADMMAPMTRGSKIYFAQPDVFSAGTLVDTLKWC